ncbi:8130_t:CDS:2 [Funneliformis geosporum]|nr:8130_t:CDS:2 [Funneliformis geosporum]
MRERIASREKIIKIFDSEEHFSYVVVNDNSRYKKDGSKSTRKGDYMEFSEIAKEFNMKIDIRAIVIAGNPPSALGATGALSTGSPPAIDQSLFYVPFRIILAPVATPALILPISVAALSWNSPAVFKPLI